MLTLTLANLDLSRAQNVRPGAKAFLRVLSGADPNACNIFETPRAIVPVDSQINLREDNEILLPAVGVLALRVSPQE